MECVQFSELTFTHSAHWWLLLEEFLHGVLAWSPARIKQLHEFAVLFKYKALWCVNRSANQLVWAFFYTDQALFKTVHLYAIHPDLRAAEIIREFVERVGHQPIQFSNIFEV